MTFSQSDPSNWSHDRLFKLRNAQKSVHYLDNALSLDNRASNLFHCQQGALADSGCGLPPYTHSACAEVRVAPLKRPRDENREVASVHFAHPESDCLKVTDSTKTIGRLYATVVLAH